MRVHVLQPTEFSCAAAVLAMATGEDIERVFDFLGHRCERRGMRWFEVVYFLGQRGFHLGAYARSIDTRPSPLVRFTWPSIRFAWPRSVPAYVVVESKSGTGHHAVYWDGQRIFDPEPININKRPDQYRIKEWWPIIKVEA